MCVCGIGNARNWVNYWRPFGAWVVFRVPIPSQYTWPKCPTSVLFSILSPSKTATTNTRLHPARWWTSQTESSLEYRSKAKTRDMTYFFLLFVYVLLLLLLPMCCRQNTHTHIHTHTSGPSRFANCAAQLVSLPSSSSSRSRSGLFR